MDSNAILIWWDGADPGTFGALRCLDISILLGDGNVTAGAWSNSEGHEEAMQVSNGVHTHAGLTQRHAGADPGIEHPFRNHRHNARRELNVKRTTE